MARFRLVFKRFGQARYRIRQGVYRIIYGIEDDALVVTVVKVGHRREVQARAWIRNKIGRFGAWIGRVLLRLFSPSRSVLIRPRLLCLRFRSAWALMWLRRSTKPEPELDS